MYVCVCARVRAAQAICGRGELRPGGGGLGALRAALMDVLLLCRCRCEVTGGAGLETR